MCDSKRQAALVLVDLLRHRRCVTLHGSHKLASHGGCSERHIHPCATALGLRCIRKQRMALAWGLITVCYWLL